MGTSRQKRHHFCLDKDDNKIEFEVRINFINPKKESKKELRTEWQTNKVRWRHIAVVTNLPIDKAGNYSFEIYLRKKGETTWGKPVFTIPLPVKQAPATKQKPN